MRLPDATVIAARDFLDREFSDPTGYSWFGTDLARCSRAELIGAASTLGDGNGLARCSRAELIKIVINLGKKESIYDWDIARPHAGKPSPR